MKRFVNNLLVTVSVSLLMAAGAHAEETQINFKLDWSLYGTHTPFFLAVEKGLYADEGLDVSVSEGDGSATVAKQVAQGRQQLGFVDFGTMVKGVQEGLPIQAVMRVISDVMVVMSDAENPIESPKELEGKVIAYAPSESTAQVIPALYQRNNVDMEDVSILQPATGAKLALFLQGRADAIPGYVNIQVAQVEQKGGDPYYFKYSDYGVSVMNNGIVVNTEFAEENPDAVRGFLRATREAFRMASNDPGSAVDALIARNPEQDRNRDLLLRQWELTIPSLMTENTKNEPFGYMAEADWKATHDIMLEYAGLPEPVELNRLYTNEYLPARDID